MIVNFFDSNITHALSYDDSLEKGRRCTAIEYSRDYDPKRVSVFTDNKINSVVDYPGEMNVAWLMEPIEYSPQHYSDLVRNLSRFDLVLTHNSTLR